MRDKSPVTGGKAAEPVEIFRAQCDHVGYVAASLAVRWHPGGTRILYIDRVDNNVHAVFEHDLSNGQSRQVFPYSAKALLFDWSPDGSKLACVVANDRDDLNRNGIWIGDPDADDWWHIEQSSQFVTTDIARSIQELRSLRPAWTRTGRKFALATSDVDSVDQQTPRHFLLKGDVETREIALLQVREERIRDLHWSPDGSRLGFVQQSSLPSLFLLDDNSAQTGPVNQAAVRRFVGWDSTGRRLGYVAAADLAETPRERWAFLFSKNPGAQDTVYVADSDGGNAGRIVFSGMRVTFANWSPREPKLSLWATFVPRYRSWWSRWFRWGLRPGDPAAILDVETGEIKWMPVNAREKAQVGHYYLLQHDYQRAHEWYEQADSEMPAENAPTLREILAAPRGLRGFGLMHAYCLSKLGRHADAERKLAEFRQLWEVAARDEDNSAAKAPDPRSIDLWLHMFEESYIAEVFLSFGTGSDSLAWLQRELDTADSDLQRLSRAVMLSQFLLRQKRHTEYAQLVDDTVLPLLIALLLEKRPADNQTEVAGVAASGVLALHFGTELFPLYIDIGAAILPLYSEDFLATLPSADLQIFIESWETKRAAAESDWVGVSFDLLLEGAYKQAGQTEKLRAVKRRISRNQGVKPLILDDELQRIVDGLRPQN